MADSSVRKEPLRFIGNPTILIVDDEELMREVTGLMIEDSGGAALYAVDGQDAVEIFRKKGESIDAVFMDFSMPRMNGYEAYTEIRKLDPEVGFLMVSGLTITPEVRGVIDSGDALFLAKPFHEHELIEALNVLCGGE